MAAFAGSDTRRRKARGRGSRRKAPVAGTVGRLRRLLPPSSVIRPFVAVHEFQFRLFDVRRWTPAIPGAAIDLEWPTLRTRECGLHLGSCGIPRNLPARSGAGPAGEALRRVPAESGGLCRI